MKKLSYVLLLILMCSCNMGRHYAHYRKGGKSIGVAGQIKSESKPIQESVPVIQSEKRLELAEKNNLDTFSVKKIHGPKKLVPVDESKIIADPIAKTKNFKRKISAGKIKAKKKNISVHSPMKSLDRFWLRLLFWASILAIIAFFIFDSIGIGILTFLIILAAGFIAVLLVFALIVWFLFEFIDSVINSSVR